MVNNLRMLSIVLSILAASTPVANAQTVDPLAVTPGALRTYSTIYSIGLEWDIGNDTNHNARVEVQYRVAGAQMWTSGPALLRIDYAGSNMLAGSLLFLAPGTSYDVRLSLSDPDGGGEVRVVAVATRRVPAPPAAGRAFHVVPGTGGGDGSAENPFRGVAAAQAIAQPGDTFQLHAGSYGGRIRFDRPGTPANYIVWKAAGDGEVALVGIDLAASHVWLEGVTVRNQANALVSMGAPADVVVTRCTFLNNHYSIYLQQGGEGWYIADNTIVGDTPATTESFAGEGVELNQTSGHTVAHNSITNVADGISYASTNVDIFGNDIFDTSDDGIEPDYGTANVRMWGNRIHNAVHNGISFQPQNGGPWYIVRNQIVSSKESPLKFRTTDRFVLVHNTIVNWAKMMCCNEHHLLAAYGRNNLWVSVQGGQIWGFGQSVSDWRTDLDYDGFDWGTVTNPFTYAAVTHSTLSSFSAASGLERNGRQISKSCFEVFNVPAQSPASVPPQVMTLLSGCPAVDAGAILPGLNDGFTGTSPDLGAHEYGQAAARYGPRPPPTDPGVAPPAAPANLLAAAASSARVDLTWTDTSAAEDGFSIQRSADGSTFTEIATVAPNVTTYADLTVNGDRTYYYRVAGWNAGGLGAYSNTAAATTPAAPLPPNAPSDLRAVAVSSSRIDLTWVDNAANESGFQVERSADGTSFAQIAVVGANVTSYSDTGLRANRTQHYRVRAYNAAGASGYSNQVSAKTRRR